MIFKNINKEDAFSLIELMISTAILMFIIIGLLYTYIACAELNDFSRNFTLVNNGLQAELEIIRETPFDDLDSLDGDTFSLAGFSSGQAIGLIDIYSTAYSDLKYIRLVACWRQKSGRVIGEDQNLDGTLVANEDLDNDNITDSPAELATFIVETE
jgi:hypothetical protein